MTKDADYQKELMRMKEIFKNVDPIKVELAEGLIEDAAWIRVQSTELKTLMVETGMIKIHPEYRQIQKPTEAAKQYMKNVNSYAVIIKTLNGILQKDQMEDEDDFERFMKEQLGAHERESE